MSLRNLQRYGEPQAGATGRAGLIGPVEALKHRGQVIGADAYAGGRHLDLHLSLIHI